MKYLFSIFVLLIITNCQNLNKNIIPEQLLSEEQMTLILLDISKLKIIKSNHFEELRSSGINPSEFLCLKYDLDSITLNENLAYYSYNPGQIKKIYEKVLDSLKKSETQIEEFIKEKEAHQQKQDSIQKALQLDSIEKAEELKPSIRI